ncbi:MAG: portal protein [Flavobacteriales bacterium]|nr:portal protein [Flavobacteriales bacterium]
MAAKTKTTHSPETAKAEYQKLSRDRQQFLSRAHECAKLTIPSLIPFENDQSRKNEDVDIEQPWQSIGSTGVNTLAAKLLVTILPPNTPFFQLTISRKQRSELAGLEPEQADQLASQIEAGLQRMEAEVVRDIEVSTLRTNLFTTLKHLLVSGNYLLYLGDDIKGFQLYKFVAVRDPSGNLMKLIVRECVDEKTLPQDLVAEAKRGEIYDSHKDGDNIELYTVVERTGPDSWVSYQEAFDQVIESTRGTYTDESLPWVCLRMIPIDGEDYARSYVEELFGDLQSSEDLTKAIVQGSMISSRLLWLVNPNGMTDADELQDASNGDILEGRVEDVQALRADKMGDFQVAQAVLQQIIARLERAFLLTSSVQRQAERVTATEIDRLTQELDDALGGYYSLLSQELQLPIAFRWINKMQGKGDIPKLPSGSVEPMIVTGIDALGRGQDLNKLRGLISDLTTLAQALPSIAQRIDEGELIQRLANGHGVDVSALIKTDEQIAAEVAEQQQAQMTQSMVDKGTAPAIQAVANNQGQ